jgi:hypothetical protein
MIKGLKDIDKLKQKLQVRMSVIRGLEGTVDVGKTTSFTPGGSFIHQDIKDADGNITMFEEESAQFEKKYPELFQFLRSINQDVNRSVEG